MNWLTLFGVPAIIAAIWTYVIKCVKALKLGTQALLRDRLYALYYECKQKSYATSFERENFENLYTQYRNLGADGVMKNIRKRFLALPIRKER